MIVILVLCGATATGKDTLKKELLKLGMDSVVCSTTRPMRDGEIPDVTYHYLTEEEFKDNESKGLFAETVSYDTVHGKWYYGSAYEDLERHENKVIILNPDGIKTFSEKVDMSDWLVIHVTCPEDIMKSRLCKRGDNPEEVERRLEADKKDFMNINRFVDVNIVNDGSKTPEQLAHNIKLLYDRHMKGNK